MRHNAASSNANDTPMGGGRPICGATVWGFARSLRQEGFCLDSHFQVRCIDVGSVEELEGVLASFCAKLELEFELTHRSGRTRLLRLLVHGVLHPFSASVLPGP